MQTAPFEWSQHIYGERFSPISCGNRSLICHESLTPGFLKYSLLFFLLWWFQLIKWFDIWNIAYMPFPNRLWKTVERKTSFKGKCCVSCAEGARIFFHWEIFKTTWECVDTSLTITSSGRYHLRQFWKGRDSESWEDNTSTRKWACFDQFFNGKFPNIYGNKGMGLLLNEQCSFSTSHLLEFIPSTELSQLITTRAGNVLTTIFIGWFPKISVNEH